MAEVLGVLTAVLTLIGGYLTYATAQANSRASELSTAVTGLERTEEQLARENRDLADRNAALADENAALAQENAELRQGGNEEDPTPPPEDGTPEVRRSDELIVQYGSPNADLDAPAADRQWGRTDARTQRELNGIGSPAFIRASGQIAHITEGEVTYEACSATSAYVNGGQVTFSLSRLETGQGFCVITDQERLSVLKIVGLEKDRVTFEATTYETQ